METLKIVERTTAASSTRPRSTKEGCARNALRKTAKARDFEGRAFDLRRAEVLDISLRAAHYELQFGQRSTRKRMDYFQEDINMHFEKICSTCQCFD